MLLKPHGWVFCRTRRWARSVQPCPSHLGSGALAGECEGHRQQVRHRARYTAWQTHDASIDAFVDDIGKTVADTTALALRRKGMLVNAELFALAGSAGMEHNKSKQELLFTALAGYGAHNVLR